MISKDNTGRKVESTGESMSLADKKLGKMGDRAARSTIDQSSLRTDNSKKRGGVVNAKKKTRIVG